MTTATPAIKNVLFLRGSSNTCVLRLVTQKPILACLQSGCQVYIIEENTL